MTLSFHDALSLGRRVAATWTVYRRWIGLAFRAALPVAGNSTFACTDNSLLLLTESWPPHISSGVYRTLSFARYGPASGWDVSVVAGPPPGDDEPHRGGAYLEGTIPQQIRVRQLQRLRHPPIDRLLPFVGLSAARAIEYVRLAEGLYDGDGPSVVLASGPPFSTYLAGAIIAAKFRSRLVLDYRDEWTTCSYGSNIYRRGFDRPWNRSLESELLGRASAVLVVTNSMRERIVSSFPALDPEKCQVFPNGWDPAHCPSDLQNIRPLSNGLSTVSHVGVLKSISDLKSFLADLESALSTRDDLRTRLRVQFIGRAANKELDQLSRFPVPDILSWENNVPLPVAVQRMAESNVLLVLATPETESALHSKVFYYIATGRPILVYGSAGETAELVEMLGVGMFVPKNSPEKLAKALDRIVQSPTSSDSARVNQWLDQHKRSVIASRLYDFLGRLA